MLNEGCVIAVEKVDEEIFCRCMQSIIYLEQSMINFLRQRHVYDDARARSNR